MFAELDTSARTAELDAMSESLGSALECRLMLIYDECDDVPLVRIRCEIGEASKYSARTIVPVAHRQNYLLGLGKLLLADDGALYFELVVPDDALTEDILTKRSILTRKLARDYTDQIIAAAEQ